MGNYSKIEIAIESLFQAKNFYESSNFICSVILAGASQRIIRDLCEAENIESVVKTIGESSGHGAKKVHDLIVECYNKTKHAEKDPNAMVFLSNEEAKVLMTIATADLVRLDRIEAEKIKDLVEFVKSFKYKI